MPLPMVHLAVAVRLHEPRGAEPSPAFLLGSIAPDAIHTRPGAGREEKRGTHLLDRPATGDRDPIAELRAGYRGADDDLRNFADGYAAHLLTDRLWNALLERDYKPRLSPDLDPAERRALYYRETDQLDFNLYHRSPWRPRVWALLGQARPPDFTPLLAAEEIARWRDRTLAWFETPEKEPRITPVYLTDAAIHAFIERATEAVAAALADHWPTPTAAR